MFKQTTFKSNEISKRPGYFSILAILKNSITRPSIRVSMANFRMKDTSCISKITQETDLKIKIAKNAQTSLGKSTRVKLEL